MSFDWQTEETIRWDEVPLPEPEPEPEPKRRRWPWVLLLVVIIIGTGLLVAYRLLSREIEEVENTAESDLLASYELIENAAGDTDSELFATFLSGKDKQWAVDLEQLVAEGDYRNRADFGLTWVAVPPATAVISTTFNPALTAAEVLSEYEYTFDIGNGLTQTVPLRQTAVYRLGPDRWLYAPPEPEFWGETITKNGFYHTIQFPERDRTLAERLALDIDTKLAEVCENRPYDCVDTFQVEVELTTGPDSLQPETPPVLEESTVGLRLRLPAPTLVGLPQSEAGYRVLARGYMAQIIRPVLRQLSGDAAAMETIFHEAWLDHELDRLSLRPYPLTAVDKQTMLQNQVSLGMGAQMWQPVGEMDEAVIPVVYAIIDFLLTDMNISPGMMMASLSTSSQLSYLDWLTGITANQYSIAELEALWQQYLQKSGPRIDAYYSEANVFELF